ncbi:hypothetical protein BDR07DRAFT_843922 [Suillus spraguei]|nr:hypothetical protein BDR07DRAFT_843922 [Suillus spraguei]
MPFPLPDHLPRQLDVSSNILSKLDSVTLQSLDSSFASSCRAELDESIQLTKTKIHDRICADSSSFQRQLSSAKSLKERLESLDTLSDSKAYICTAMRYKTPH